MKQLDFMSIFSIFQEMLGAFLWPLFFIAIFGLMLFIGLLVFDRRIVYRRLGFSLLVGVFGGAIGLFILGQLSISSFTDAAGPIDWLMVIGVYLGGFAAATVIIYTLFGWISAFRQPTSSV